MSTGCFTCRERRKKCDGKRLRCLYCLTINPRFEQLWVHEDASKSCRTSYTLIPQAERKPECLNCEKTNKFCEFPKKVYWENRSTARVTTRSNSDTPIPQFDGISDTVSGFTDGNAHFTQWDGLPSQSSAHYDTQWIGHLETHLAANAGFMLDGFGESGTNTAITSDQGAAFPEYPELSTELVTRDEVSRDQVVNRQAFQQTFFPIELPFLIAGVDSAMQQNMFCHFVNTTSKFLTTLSGQSNPFNQVVIPMALSDQTLMNTLLCLAGSHLLKVQGTVSNEKLAAERCRLHQNAVRTQAVRIEDLRRGSGALFKLQYRECVLATSLLLCLFEICEGTGDDSGKAHLETAREIITMGSMPTSSTSRTTDINPFLLEFFLYHDSLATVTSPSPVLKPQFHSLSQLPDQDTSLVGVQDGLINFITQISALRAEADTSKHQPDGNIICRAVQIWQDLANWKPKFPMTKERNLITEFYQWALFIWLFSIIYPDGKADLKVQNAVQRITTGMYEINSGDGVMACLLFPLFVVGSAAITKQDRQTVLSHFKKLRNWSALGNIDLTEKVVRKMWDDHDDGVQGSWDWIRQLEIMNGLSLLVT